MLPIDQITKKLAPVIGQNKANHLLYRYNSLPNFQLKKKLEDKVRLLCYRLLGRDYEEKILLTPPSRELMSREFELGDVIYNEQALFGFGVSGKELLMHTAIMGRSGSGKTNVAFKLIYELQKNKTPFCIFDWKKNYRSLTARDKSILVFTPGSKTSPFYFNPLIPPAEIAPEVWKEMLCAAIGYSYFIGEGALTILEKGIDQVYQNFGVYTGTCQEFPTFKDVTRIIMAKSQRRGREMLWFQSCARVLHALTESTISKSINVPNNPIPLAELIQHDLIIELDYLATSNKVFLTQALLLWIYFHRLHQPKTEELRQMVIIEEAQNLLLQGKENIKSGDILPKIIREFRELGIGLCFIAQEASKINSTALQNCYTLMALNQRWRKDIEALASSMSLKFYEWDFLGKIPLGECIVNMKGEFPESFLVKIPLVKEKTEVSDAELKKHMEQAYFKKISHKLPRFPEQGGFQGISNNANLSPSKFLHEKNKKDLLLVEVLEHPFISVTQHYRNLGLNYREGNEIKKELQRQGYLMEAEIQRGAVRLKILSLTEKGREHLEKQGWKVPKVLPGGPAHEYWKAQIKKTLIEKGAKVEEEAVIENADQKKGD